MTMTPAARELSGNMTIPRTVWAPAPAATASARVASAPAMWIRVVTYPR
jgi:hypothetical protein